MQARHKVVELSGHKFQIRRLPTEVGSFIFMRMLGVNMRSRIAEGEVPPSKETRDTAPSEQETVNVGEMRVRALAFSVFSGSIGFEDYTFIQKHCMKVVSILTERAGVEFPLPVMNDAGNWTPEGELVADDVRLVMNLTAEVLVLCFASFFDEGVLGS